MTIMNMTGRGAQEDATIPNALLEWPYEHDNTLAVVRSGSVVSGYANMTGQPIDSDTLINYNYYSSSGDITISARTRINKQSMVKWTQTFQSEIRTTLSRHSDVVLSGNRIVIGVCPYNEINDMNGYILMVNADGTSPTSLKIPSISLSNITLYGLYPFNDTDALLIFSSYDDMYYSHIHISDTLITDPPIQMNISAEDFVMNSSSCSGETVYVSYYNSSTTHPQNRQTANICFYITNDSVTMESTDLTSSNYLDYYTAFNRTYVLWGTSRAHADNGFIGIANRTTHTTFDISISQYDLDYLFLITPDYIIGLKGGISNVEGVSAFTDQTYALDDMALTAPTLSKVQYVLSDGVTQDGQNSIFTISDTSDRSKFDGVVFNDILYIWN